MVPFDVFHALLLIIAMILGGKLGVFRVGLLLLLLIVGYFSFAFFQASSEPLTDFFRELGFQDRNSSVISALITFLMPLIFGIILSFRLLSRVLIGKFNEEDAASKILGSVLTVIIYLLLIELI